jgi:hypothetical protein
MKGSGAAVILVLAAALSGCDGFIWLHGKVVDSSGAPIPSAVVELFRSGGGREFKDPVNANGCILSGGSTAPIRSEWNVVVSAPGYKSIRTKIEGSGSHTICFNSSLRLALLGVRSSQPPWLLAARSNNSFKPNLLRSSKRRL